MSKRVNPRQANIVDENVDMIAMVSDVCAMISEVNLVEITPSNLSMQRNVEYPKALHYWVNSTRLENDY
ncbi:hypothetical protein Tco_1120646 [Tanacetum coccineum]